MFVIAFPGGGWGAGILGVVAIISACSGRRDGFRRRMPGYKGQY